MITLTASTRSTVAKLIKNQPVPMASLRIAVTGGGCAGYQYALSIDTAPAAGDLHLHCDGIQMLVDPVSASLLDGVTIDFVDSLTGSGFTFHHPNAKNSCGCGASFSA